MRGPGKLLKLLHKTPNNSIRSAIHISQSRQVMALTLASDMSQYKQQSCASANLFLVVERPAAQLTSPPANHTFQRHINDPHYVARPYGTCSERASTYATGHGLLDRPKSRLHQSGGQALGDLSHQKGSHDCTFLETLLMLCVHSAAVTFNCLNT